jgi:hypothetical protein
VNSEPTYRCLICNTVIVVRPDGRGFPPGIAKRKLKRSCTERGCPCDPKYRPGFIAGPKR